MSPKLDAAQAEELARRYVEKMCGNGGLFRFETTSVVFHPDRAVWALRCPFWCLGSFGDTTKPRVRMLLIDDASGKVVGSGEEIEAK